MSFRKLDPYYIILGLALLVFVAFKWRFLDLPLYWDEAWVYGPAVRAMHASGLSLLPNTIGTELSRGHPLLFHFMAAFWAQCFGDSNASLHAFALTLSVALLIVIFQVGKFLGSPLIGLSAVLVTGLNEIFLAQSSILLPEIPLALFSLLALWAFISKNWFGYLVAATCALFIKESAIVLIIAVFCWNLISSLWDRDGNGSWPALKRSLIALAPIVPGVLFLGYQKVTYGWYFFPVHLGLISWDIKDIHYLFKFGYREAAGTELADLYVEFGDCLNGGVHFVDGLGYFFLRFIAHLSQEPGKIIDLLGCLLGVDDDFVDQRSIFG